jgi:uncharacterized membrane protein YagU involved in acid resistance
MRVLPAILCGGLICGALDITAAFIVYGAFGLMPIPLLQGIAAGLLGKRAFAGGLATALLGLFLEFFIATSAAAVYVLVSRILIFLTRRAALAGALYGIAVYFFMQLVVLPLSEAIHRPFSLKYTIIGVVIHICCVGLPIALVTRRFARQ